MKKNISIITMLIILIFTIVFSSYKSDVIITSKKTVKEAINYIDTDIDIVIKKTDELGNPLSGIIFKLKDFNNVYEMIIPESNTPGIYEYYENTYDRYSFKDIVSLLPEQKQNIINKFKTKEDIEKSNLYNECLSDYCRIVEIVPLVVEEVKAPSGYIKEKKIILGFAELYYYFEDNQIVDKGSIVNVSTKYYFDYKQLINVETIIQDIIDGKYNDIIKSDCQNPINERIIDYNSNNQSVQFSQIIKCGMNIINKKGTIDLSVENYVNKTSNILTNKNQKIDYSIIVKNSGTASSTENTIVSEVPKGLEYVEDSASPDGEYNEKEHQVEWKIEEIEAEETLELTYEAIVPKDADPNIEYIGTTSINSREVPEDIKSEETIVKIEKTPITNPKTNSFMNFILLVIPGILVSGTYFTTKRKVN